MAEHVRIRLLGPVAALRGAAAVDPGSPRQRAVLAVLASHPGQVVPIPRLVESLWGEHPPRSAEQSVYTYVAGLRRALEPSRKQHRHSELLVGGGGGYRLEVEARHVDAVAFAGHVESARLAMRRDGAAEALTSLEEALSLWHGDPLTGVPGPFADAERARLAELRLTAAERHAEALLGLGRPHDALPPLRDLTRRHPIRERLRELLVLALLRSGNRAEALEVYNEGGRILREELGVDPGAALRAAYELALREPGPAPAAPPPGRSRSPEAAPAAGRMPVVPRELPRDLGGFVGRRLEIIRIQTHLAPWDGSAPSPLVVISGPPGVGKSALAARVAAMVKDRFPDGQLYVNLRGATTGMPGLEPLEVLGRFLRALGAAGDAVPADVDEAAAAWRSRMAGRRMLVLLDDAAGLPQIQPLLSAPRGTAILVTSRESLAAGDDSVRIHLPRMAGPEAAAVLSTLAGAQRITADPEQTARLVRFCDGLPLALRIAGARLADRPDWSVAALNARLGDERRRLHELEAGELAVRSSLAASWNALARSARPLDRLAARTLALIGLPHVHDITAEAAAALLGTGVLEAERALERLVDAHLLDQSGSDPAAPPRYQLHDLVRIFAAELTCGPAGPADTHAAPGRLSPGEAAAALARVLGHWIASARLASTTMDPHRVQPDGPELDPVDATPHHVGDADEARDWLAREEPNLVAAATQAMACPNERLARLGVALVFSLQWYLHGAHDSANLIALNREALRVSRRLGDRLSTYHALGHLAGGLSFQRRTAEAVEHLRAQLVLARELGDRFSEQRTLGNLANTFLVRRAYRECLSHARAQLALAREIGSQVGERYALIMLGTARHGLGRSAEARQALTEALASARRVGDISHEGLVQTVLGEIFLDEGEPAAALEPLRQALELRRASWFRIGQLRCLVRLSQAHRALGAPRAALPYVTEALPLAVELGNPEWLVITEEEHAAVHALLGAVTPP
ncbi:BTAD domain-containing putative transcriptional regulator [Nonomuraea sp. NPDC023979]|uniref:AfsR/SARP family transcriptional regulator n=1 Tax=Nonomuraea sp. NPDC023979 TaxID=3154796 RepID=UPI0034056066